MISSSKIKGWLFVAITVSVIVGLAYFFRIHIDLFKKFVEGNPISGVLIFISVGIIDAMILPGASLPVIPAASHIWGHWLTAFLTVTGWLIGTSLAFTLARHYGGKIIYHLVPPHRLEEFKKIIPKKIFWFVVVSRLVFPLDFFSYALGLFSHVSHRDYMVATLIGIIPSAILLSVIGKLPPIFESLTLLGGAVLFVWLGVYFRKKLF